MGCREPYGRGYGQVGKSPDRSRVRGVSSTTGMVSIEAFGRSHVGRVRTTNEDCFVIADLGTGAWLLAGGVARDRAGRPVDEDRWSSSEPVRLEAASRGPLLLVCDGMGGAAGGEVASELAARVVWEEMCRTPATTDRTVYGRLLRRAVRVANHRVWQEGQSNSRLRGMGTTLSAAGLVGDVLVLAQIGDSRAYLQRGSHLVQLTRDQSVASALVHAGRLSADEVKRSPHAHTILQALGVRKDVDVALSIARLRQGDRLLLCSDGLYGPVGDDVLRALLLRHADMRVAIDDLLAAACAAGGPDNITAVLVRFAGNGLAAPAGADDVPRFTELDPMEEGERALLATSQVARRLAARAGIGDDPGPPVVPATGQHVAVPPVPHISARTPEDMDEGELGGPAAAVVHERSRLGLVPWILAALVLLVAGGLLVWGW